MKRRWITLVALGCLLGGVRGATAAELHVVHPPAPPVAAVPIGVAPVVPQCAPPPDGVDHNLGHDHGYGAPGMFDGYGGDPKGPRNVRWGYYPGVYGYGRYGTYYRPFRGNYQSQGTTNYQPPYYGWYGPSAQHLNDRLGPRIN